MHQKAGRFGRFYAVMMMSPGCGLARPGRGLDFLDTERYLPMRTILGQRRVSKTRLVCAMPDSIDSRALNWAGVDAGLRSRIMFACEQEGLGTRLVKLMLQRYCSTSEV